VERHVPSDDDPLASAVERSTAVLDFERDAPFFFSLTVRNRGPFPVKLEGLVPSFDGWEGPMFFDGLRLGTDRGVGEPKQIEFTPTTIEPDDELEIFVTGHFQGVCDPPPKNEAAISFVDSVELRYSYARVFERTQQVQLPENVAVACAIQILDDEEFDG
jgi:hypothetical protein